MNYLYQRNPERLVRKLGFVPDAAPTPKPAPSPVFPHGLPAAATPLESAQLEQDFMVALHGLDEEHLGELVVVMGGFMDGSLANGYAICATYPQSLRQLHDVFYREHPEGNAVRELVELYRHRGKRVVLIGHSWGGDAVVHAVARKTRALIHLLVTLDPVSRKKAPAKPLDNVQHWLNVYVDYTTATWANSSNLTARIGGPWQFVRAAHENVCCSHNHDAAHAMFRDHAMNALMGF